MSYLGNIFGQITPGVQVLQVLLRSPLSCFPVIEKLIVDHHLVKEHISKAIDWM